MKYKRGKSRYMIELLVRIGDPIRFIPDMTDDHLTVRTFKSREEARARVEQILNGAVPVNGPILGYSVRRVNFISERTVAPQADSAKEVAP